MTLGPLALWLRQENPTAGLVSEDALLAELTRHFMGEDWGLKRGEAARRADQFLNSVRRYSNLLVERGHKQYGFMHLTFEEMLAAYGLYQRGVEACLPIIQEHVAEAGWRETILLAVGVWGVANKNPREAGRVVRSILKMDVEGKDRGQAVLLAGACLEDVGESGLGRAAAAEVQSALMEAMRDRSLPPVVQRDAGSSLARTGWVPEDLDAWIQREESGRAPLSSQERSLPK